jgi:hypothetical protein
MSAPGLREALAVAERALDPAFAHDVAQAWVETHLPGRDVGRVRPHSALYGGAGQVSLRVTATLGATRTRSTGWGAGAGHGAGAGARLTTVTALDAVTLLVRCRDGELSVTAFPDDPALPTLPAMLDPEVAGGALAALGLGDGGPVRVTVVHHPRTGPCVVRYEFSGADPARPRRKIVYAKVYPGRDDARAAAARAAALGVGTLRGPVGPGGRSGPVRLPRLLGLDAGRHTIFLESLSAPAGSPVRVREAAAVLRVLHDHVPRGALPARSASADLAGAVDAELEVVASAWPHVADRVRAALRPARRVLATAPALAPVLSHGDFTPAQLVRLVDGIGLLDLDTLFLGDAAADAGRYLAYHDLAQARRRTGAVPSAPPPAPRTPSETARAAFLTTYCPADPESFAARVDGYRALSLGLHALHAARRFKDERVARALALLEHDVTGG